MIPPTSILKVFPLQNVFEIKKCSSTKCFRTLRQERSDGKSLEAPPISQHKQFSILKTWWNTEGFHYRKVLLLWDITIPKYSSNPPLSYPKNVSILECLWNTEGYSTKSFATVRQKNRREIKILTSPYIHKIFANQIVSEPQ